jgi:hypothetical protein
VRLVLSLEKTAEIVGHWENTAFAILGGAWIKPDLAAPEIDLTPLEREDFARNPPPRDVGELDDRSKRRGQMV